MAESVENRRTDLREVPREREFVLHRFGAVLDDGGKAIEDFLGFGWGHGNARKGHSFTYQQKSGDFLTIGVRRGLVTIAISGPNIENPRQLNLPGANRVAISPSNNSREESTPRKISFYRNWGASILVFDPDTFRGSKFSTLFLPRIEGISFGNNVTPPAKTS